MSYFVLTCEVPYPKIKIDQSILDRNCFTQNLPILPFSEHVLMFSGENDDADALMCERHAAQF